MSRARVLLATIPGMISDEDLLPLRAVADVVCIETDHIDESTLAAKCGGIDVLMLNYDVVKRLTPKFYEHRTVQELKSISTDITGMDWASPVSAHNNNVVLQNVPRYSTESVAETTVAEVLLHSRQRLLAFKDAIAGRDVQGRQGINLVGRKAGIVGYGSIGSRVAEILHCFGMQIMIWNRTTKAGIQNATLATIFSECDVICICAATVLEGPQSNKGFIGKDLISRCSDTIIVNLASEHLVDESAVIAALENGSVRGYSVERTKTTASSALARIETVHLAPSNSWNSPESLQTLRDIWVANTISSLKGKPSNIFIVSE